MGAWVPDYSFGRVTQTAAAVAAAIHRKNVIEERESIEKLRRCWSLTKCVLFWRNLVDLQSLVKIYFEPPLSRSAGKHFGKLVFVKRSTR
jgi:hypothetical protein